MQITVQDLENAGFRPEFKNHWRDGPQPTGYYTLPHRRPEPKVDTKANPDKFFAQIGGLNWWLKNEQDLTNFTNKAIPAYTE